MDDCSKGVITEAEKIEEMPRIRDELYEDFKVDLDAGRSDSFDEVVKPMYLGERDGIIKDIGARLESA